MELTEHEKKLCTIHPVLAINYYQNRTFSGLKDSIKFIESKIGKLWPENELIEKLAFVLYLVYKSVDISKENIKEIERQREIWKKTKFSGKFKILAEFVLNNL